MRHGEGKLERRLGSPDKVAALPSNGLHTIIAFSGLAICLLSKSKLSSPCWTNRSTQYSLDCSFDLQL